MKVEKSLYLIVWVTVSAVFKACGVSLIERHPDLKGPKGDLGSGPTATWRFEFWKRKKEFNGARIFFIISGTGKMDFYVCI